LFLSDIDISSLIYGNFTHWPFKKGEETMASSLNIYAGIATIHNEFAACTPLVIEHF
jgi:hypothetical protein